MKATKFMAVLLCITMILSGCGSMNNTTKGGLLGGGGGAALGAVVGGLIGKGKGAAIGAGIATDEKVIVINGDGDIQMNIQELATLKENDLDVIVFILNNSEFGIIRQWQEDFYDMDAYQVRLNNPDFIKLASSYRIDAIRVDNLDDLELVDAKERKRQLREIRRQAKRSRNNPNYNSNYDSPYGSNDPYYDDYGGYDDYDGYSRDMNYGRAPRDNYSNQYDSRRRPDSHHHQYSGAIKDSYSRNPDKYFANNYEEFHQNNLDAQRDYDDYIQGRNQYAEDYIEEPQKAEKKSRGLSRFNPFSSNKDEKEDDFVDISDAEFDTTINQAMHEMDDNIKFQPSNDNRFREGHNQSYGSRGYDREYDRGHSRAYDMNYDGYDDRYYDDYSDRHNANSNRYHDSRPLRDNYNNHNHYDNRHESFNQRDYRQNENYRKSHSRNPNYGSNSHHYDANRTRTYSGDGEIDYKYMSPRESRKRSGHNSSSHYDDYSHYRDESDGESGNDNKNKTSDDLFEKHSRKFRR